MSVLKKTNVVFLFLFLFLFCKKKVKNSNIESNKKMSIVNTKSNKDNNINIINGLNKLKEVIEKSDNKEFSYFFKFPSKKYFYVNPQQAIKTFKDSLITREYFIKHSYVPNVDKNASLDNLLENIDLNLLKISSVVEKRFEVKDDECYYYYKIEVSNNGKNVKLQYKSITNSKYEDDEYTCEPESDIIYMKLEGSRLLFDQDKIQMYYEPAAG